MKRGIKMKWDKKTQKTAFIAGAIAIVVLAVILISVYRPAAGKAVFIGNQPWTGELIDLTSEETVSVTALPDEDGIEIPIRSATTVEPGMEQDYTFRLQLLEENTYLFMVRDAAGSEIARDIIIAGETTPLYLDIADAVPDASVSFSAGTITFKNLHFLPAERAQIDLLNAQGNAIPSIIALQPGQQFTATLRARSNIPPGLQVSVRPATIAPVLGTPVQNPALGLTEQSISFAIPANAEASALTLDIAATVQAEVTHQYYTLSVGGLLYQFQETGFPRMEVRDVQQAGATQRRFTAQFVPVTDLQPFAIPCAPAAPAVNALFGNTNVESIITYNSVTGAPQVWTNGAPGDLTQLSPTQGYFVRLAQPQPTQVQIACSTAAMPLTLLQIRPGWNLISIPGFVSRPFTEFTPERNFRVFACQLGYTCTEMPRETPLNPGQPYWINSEAPFTAVMQ